MDNAIKVLDTQTTARLNEEAKRLLRELYSSDALYTSSNRAEYPVWLELARMGLVDLRDRRVIETPHDIDDSFAMYRVVRGWKVALV